MKYTQKSFSVGGSSPAYSANFDRIFRKCTCRFEFRDHIYTCELDRGHEGDEHRALLVDGERPTDYVEWNTLGSQSFICETAMPGD